jgi:acyl-homoserine-lactone acylase
MSFGFARYRTLPCVLAVSACATAGLPAPPPLPEPARQVEIRRTAYGVPHILAENLRAAGFALAWVQLEDHGAGIIRGMHAARGRLALVEGEERVDADARARQRHARALETFDRLAPDTHDVYTGFAEGMNHFIRVHRAELPDWMQPDFTGPDILARDIGGPADSVMNAFRRRLLEDPSDPAVLVASAEGEWRRAGAAGPAGAARRPAGRTGPGDGVDSAAADAAQNVGSNAWALAPGRTASGRAILLRNPHLAWTAGYYEAHVRVPGKLDFYGDFRIGGPFTVIGGFNAHLGFATTNNASRSHEFYAFRADRDRPDHILVDGRAVPLRRDTVAVEYRAADGRTAVATRVFLISPYGPVVHEGDSIVYVFRPAGDGEFRAGEQWLEMMKAGSLEEWKRAMRIGARTTSNFTYADRDGNIFYVWVAAAPVLPHPSGGDTLAVLVTRSDQVWSRVAEFDALPQVLNPPGGYVRNENDSPHYTNLNRLLPHDFAFHVEPPRLRLRSQHGIELLHNDRVFSLEDVVEAKHSPRMLLADRVKDDLLDAVRAAGPAGDAARAAGLLAAWDNTAGHASRGGVLFETWWNRYRTLMGGEGLHAVEWTPDEPVTTPRGLADAGRAVEAFLWAVPETARRFGAWDVAWGDVHRVRRGDVDAPVAGCGGALGCFRVLNFATEPDGRRAVNGGDGWVIAVEFTDTPRAYSVLAYGQSPDPTSPHHADQAAMFAAGEMKRVRWTEADIAAGLIARYRPGEVVRTVVSR